MKALLFFLCLTLAACAHTVKTPDTLNSTKVKVMVIDTGHLSLALNDLNIKASEIPQPHTLDTVSSLGGDSSHHGADVMRVFDQTLTHLSPDSAKQVALVFCQIDAKTLDLSFCLEKAVQERVSFMNISVAIHSDITLRERLALHRLSDNGVVITVAAGNEKSLITKESLCGMELKNKFCVAGFDDDLNLATNSNFGPLVNAYAPMKMAIVSGGSAWIISGTSFSSPYKLAQIIAFKIKNPLKAYNFNEENAMIQKTPRSLASQ